MIATNAGRFVDVRLSTERPMWPKLNPQPESELAAARLALHWAAQIPAAASSLVPAADDYTHTSLTWTNGSLVTSSLGDSRRRVALDLLGFAVELIDDEGPTQRLPLSGHTISSAVSWLSAHLGTELSLLPHELPEHPVGSGERFADPDPATLEALYSWFAASNLAISAAVSGRDGASPVRCWPHHFDMASLVDLGAGRSIGVGMTPGDGSHPSPYFYVTPWPYPSGGDYPALSNGARWHTDGWVGALLEESGLRAEDQRGQVAGFLDEAFEACAELLHSTARSTSTP